MYDSGSNYMTFHFADKKSANHESRTPNSYFTRPKWYYLVANVDYSTGKYESYIYEEDGTLKWSNTKT